jgi:hypothetical protein
MKPKILLMALLAVISLTAMCSQAAWALTTEQVIRLRKAGVSNETILKIIENETEMRKRGYLGRYVVKQQGGGELVVYEAKSPRGVVDYPLEAEGEAGGVKPLTAALGIEERTSGGTTSAGYSSLSNTSSGAGGYTVHLFSYKKASRARRSVALLKQYGVKAMVREVDLKSKGIWHRVVTGEFNSRKSAKAFGDKLKSEGKIKEFWVVKL